MLFKVYVIEYCSWLHSAWETEGENTHLSSCLPFPLYFRLAPPFQRCSHFISLLQLASPSQTEVKLFITNISGIYQSNEGDMISHHSSLTRYCRASFYSCETFQVPIITSNYSTVQH